MGFKLSVLALPGEWSLERLVRLRLCGSRQLGTTHRDDAFYPAEEPCIARVPGHTCVFWFGLYERLVTGKEDPSLEERLLEATGVERAFYFGLVSTVNLYWLLAWQNGTVVRRLGGWSDEVNFDEGAPLPEEATARARFSVEREGPLPSYRDKTSGELYAHDQVGENFVMAASAAVFGAPLDDQHGAQNLPEQLPRYETWDAYTKRVHG